MKGLPGRGPEAQLPHAQYHTGDCPLDGHGLVLEARDVLLTGVSAWPGTAHGGASRDPGPHHPPQGEMWSEPHGPPPHRPAAPLPRSSSPYRGPQEVLCGSDCGCFCSKGMAGEGARNWSLACVPATALLTLLAMSSLSCFCFPTSPQPHWVLAA
uniref:Uncharacterized protein n=1 Tax=Molossus molossus TaxID=27622 RepID=A0A7J8J7K3_MOLMO|nr:hypothetical protein HJG59_009633 [Molossus molossus]